MKYKDEAKQFNLHAPPEFWLVSEDELATYGCGWGKGLGDALVPDTMYGMSVKVCCIIHDMDWRAAQALHDIHRANERFLVNLIALINGKSKSAALRVLRRYRATTYYTAVQEVGARFFREAEGRIDVALAEYYKEIDGRENG